MLGGILPLKWLPHINGGCNYCTCARAHSLTPLIYLGNGWTDCADIWHVGSDLLVMWLQHAHVVSLCTWARAHPASISWERLNWLCSNLLREQRPIWYLCGFDKEIGVPVHVRNCTLHLFFRVLAWIGWFKVDCGISRGNFQPTWHVQVTLRHLSCARSFIAHKAFILVLSTSDRMHDMIQTEARLFILWLFFRYACLPNWKYAAAKIHMHFSWRHLQGSNLFFDFHMSRGR